MPVRNRWTVLSISMVAQVASVSAMFGVPVVLPQLREAFGVTTAQAGVLAGLPSFGLLLTLLLWGVVIDRAGERATMALSLFLTAGALGLLWSVSQLWSAAVVLLLVGAVGGPVNAASGRLVLTWFVRRERGLAMGIRQSACAGRGALRPGDALGGPGVGVRRSDDAPGRARTGRRPARARDGPGAGARGAGPGTTLGHPGRRGRRRSG